MKNCILNYLISLFFAGAAFGQAASDSLSEMAAQISPKDKSTIRSNRKQDETAEATKRVSADLQSKWIGKNVSIQFRLREVAPSKLSDGRFSNEQFAWADDLKIGKGSTAVDVLFHALLPEAVATKGKSIARGSLVTVSGKVTAIYVRPPVRNSGLILTLHLAADDIGVVKK